MSKHKVEIGIIVVLFCATATFSDALADDEQHPSPLKTVKDGNYPVGGKLVDRNQTYRLFGKDGPKVAPDIGDFKEFEAITEAVRWGALDKAQSQVKTASPNLNLQLNGAAATVVRTAGKWFVHYPVQYQGIPLAEISSNFVMVDKDGRAQLLRERLIPSRVDGARPKVSAKAAQERCLERARKYSGDLFVEPHRLEIWTDPENPEEGRLAWKFTVRSNSLKRPFGYRYWVSAMDSTEILAEENIVYHVDGTVRGKVWTASPLGQNESRPLADVTVASGNETARTDQSGNYDLPTAGNVSVEAQLEGAFCDVQNRGTGGDLKVTKDGIDQVDLVFDPIPANDESQLAQISAYYWTTKAHEFSQDVLGTNLLLELPTRVNIDDSCNAFWNGSSINFFRSGSGCANTAYADVVLHEYGHGVDARIGGILDGGYSEGFGDALAVLQTRQPLVGRDFFGAGNPLRDATDIVKWTDPDVGEGSGEVHRVGEVYGGFTWALIEELTKTEGDEDRAFAIAKDLILAAAAGNPADIPDAVRLSFLADDDDGDLSNGTPHAAELLAAAKSRAIPTPGDLPDGSENGPPSSGHAFAASRLFGFGEKTASEGVTGLLRVQIVLTEPMDVHVSANTSVTSAQPALFTTGFSDQAAAPTPDEDVMWIESLRFVEVSKNEGWTNFSSLFTTRLPAGTHDIHWKVWVDPGQELSFDSGALTVKAFPLPTAGVAAASVETRAGRRRQLTEIRSQAK